MDLGKAYLRTNVIPLFDYAKHLIPTVLIILTVGSVLDVPTHTVNMTTLRSANDLWQSYSIRTDNVRLPLFPASVAFT